MTLRNAVLSRGIIWRPIKRDYRSLARHAALELASHFFRAALFQRIGTPPRDERERADDRQGFHLLILGSKCANAIADCKVADASMLKQLIVVAALAPASADV
jgi:hypothetical protein